MELTQRDSQLVEIGGLLFRRMIDEDRIIGRIAQMGEELSAALAAELPLMIGVLNGGAIFHSELIRAMPIPLTVDYLRVASYGDGTTSSGNLTFSADCGTEIGGRNVILVEDIVDTGRTVLRLRDHLLARGAKSVAVAALLYKREADLFEGPPEYVGFEIPDRFVIGFGLDYRQEGRNLRHIYALEEA
jgi:hypoxanthine phosphoribosyltransferase